MRGEFSQTAGSFERTGNYPLEANYIFHTVDDLREFYADELNATTLHKGLLRVVEDDGTGKQCLYWVTKKATNDELEFTKLITYMDIPDLSAQLEEFIEKINQEIEDRRNADDAIWGDIDHTVLPDDLNSLKDLAEAVLGLRASTSDISKDLLAVVGTEESIIPYLQKLPYHSLTEVAITLHKFLETVNKEDESIQTLPELQYFLAGYTDKDNLKTILEQLYKSIVGGASESFNSLEEIENKLKKLKQKLELADKALQDEIDATQKGVGLDSSGRFSPDAYTYYLKESTSVMNALRTLDSLLYNVITTTNIKAEDTETVDMTVSPYRNETVISARVKVAPKADNQIVIEQDGIYHNVDFNYSNGRLDLIVNGGIVKYFDLGLSGLVNRGYYDSKSEEIVIVLSLPEQQIQELRIPAGLLIEEWEILNNEDSAVILHKDRNVSGKDTLSADVRISTNSKNILQKDASGRLSVKGSADNIRMSSGQTIESVINDINSNLGEYNSSINSVRDSLIEETTARIEADKALQTSLAEEKSRAEKAEQDLDNKISLEKVRAEGVEKNLQDSIDHINELLSQSDGTLEEKVSKVELDLSKLSDNYNEHKVQVEKDKAEITNSITELSGKVSSNSNSIEELKKTTSANQEKISETQQAVHAEEDRASKEEHRLEDLIDGQTSIISSLTEKVTNVETTVSDMKSSVDEAKSSAKEAKALAESFAADISNIKQASQSLQEALTKEISDRAEGDKTLKESIDQLKSQFENIINQKLEPLIQRVEAIESTLTWNKHEE